MSNIQKSINLKENLEHAVAYTKKQVKDVFITNKPFKHDKDLEKKQKKATYRLCIFRY